jgi:indolepyruvate ferredoxin oxidoreductase alpha subunit
MLEVIATYPEIYAEWSVNEKVALEVAIGAAFAGSRAFCAMKHVGMNVTSDALMTLTLTGVIGGVIAIADDVGLSSSQNAPAAVCACSPARPKPSCMLITPNRSAW